MRFIVHAAAVLVLFAATVTHSLAQDAAAALPAAWDGVWRGEIEVLAGGKVTLAIFTDGATIPDGTKTPEWLQGQPWSELPTRGRIGFQGRHAGAGIEFCNVKLLRLSSLSSRTPP